MISVIIPLYNKEKSIARTIQSVMDQTFVDFELIIIDDGSTDRSLQVARGFSDPRIRIIGKQNEGVSATRNQGARVATSDYLFFLDADDYIYPSCLQILTDEILLYPEVSLWSANYESRSPSSTRVAFKTTRTGVVDQAHQAVFWGDWFFRIGSFIVRKDDFLASGGFPSSFTVGEDYMFLDQFVSKYKCAYVPDVVMAYMQDSRFLSAGKIHYSQSAEYFLHFSHKNNWQRLKYSELITKRMIKAILKFNFEESAAMVKLHGWYCALGFISIFVQQIYRTFK